MQAIRPKTPCVNCISNNRTEDGREWCLNNCARAWKVNIYQDIKPAPVTTGNRGKRKTGIMCVDTGAKFNSIRQAEATTGGMYNTLWCAVTVGNLSYGLKWIATDIDKKRVPDPVAVEETKRRINEYRAAANGRKFYKG